MPTPRPTLKHTGNSANLDYYSNATDPDRYVEVLRSDVDHKPKPGGRGATAIPRKHPRYSVRVQQRGPRRWEIVQHFTYTPRSHQPGQVLTAAEVERAIRRNAAATGITERRA